MPPTVSASADEGRSTDVARGVSLTGSHLTDGYAALCRLVASGPPLAELLPGATAIVGEALSTRCVAVPGETVLDATLELERGLEGLTADERAFFGAASELVAGALRQTARLETVTASRDEYRRLLDHLPIVTYVDREDRTSSTLYASRPIVDLLGYPLERWLEDDGLWVEILHPDDRDRILAVQDDTASPWSHEYRLVARDGSTVWVHDEARREVLPDGRPVWLGYLIDITERMRAEEESQEANRRYRTLVEEMPGVVYVDEPDATPSTRYISPHIEELVGYTPQEIVEQPTLWEQEIVHPDDRATLRADILRSRAGEQITREYRCVTKGGETVWVLDQSSPQLDANGRIATIRGYLLDITERKRVEQEREEAQERFRTLVEEMPAVVYLVAADPTASIIFINHQIEDILGYTLEEWASAPEFFVERVLHPDDRKAVLDSIARNNAGEGNSCEYRCLAKDGRVVWFWDESIPELDENGVAVATRGFMVDITDRKNAEEELEHRDEQLRQAQRLEAIGRLAGGIAHDFNNLLTVIIGYVDMMRRNEPLDERLVLPLAEVSSAADRAASLTRQLLAFSRQQVLEPEVLDLADVVAGLGTMLRRLLGERVDLIVRSSTEPATVRVDRGQIEQVVVNLAVNARDAMPRGGAITIETRPAGRRAEGAGAQLPVDAVELLVSDTGTGLDAETARRMFEPFFTTKETAGTGLGLSIVHGIVEQSGGSIEVDSRPGLGTTFRILLPFVARAPSGAGGELVAAAGLTASG